MGNAAIPTLSTGNVLTATNWNILTELNSQIGLFGLSGALAGSGVATGPPQFLVQTMAATISYTTGVNGYALVFPVTYPTGLLAVNITAVDASYFARIVSAATSKAQVQFILTNGTSEAASGTYTVTLIAIGW